MKEIEFKALFKSVFEMSDEEFAAWCKAQFDDKTAAQVWDGKVTPRMRP